VPAEKRGWAVGSILAEGDEEADDELLKLFEGHGFKLFNLPAVQRAVNTMNHCYSRLSYVVTGIACIAVGRYLEVLLCKFTTFLDLLEMLFPHATYH